MVNGINLFVFLPLLFFVTDNSVATIKMLQDCLFLFLNKNRMMPILFKQLVY